MFESLNSRNDRVISGLRMLKVRSMTNQQPHWGACQQCDSLASPRPLESEFLERSSKLHCNKCSRIFLCPLDFRSSEFV